MPGSTSKPPRQWVEADVADLITNSVKEDLNLDYKACASLQKTDGKKAEISKDVSAFANAAGGTIVYGVKEDGHVPTEIDVGFEPDDISKEWLENVINSTIKPRIDGVVINQVELSTSNPGRVLYVVDIPQTIAGGPHQANDKRYYKRFNFKSEPMEDYEIRDVMRRALGPDLYCNVYVGDRVRFEEPATNRPFAMMITVGNTSPEPALYAHFDLFLPDTVSVESSRSVDFLPVRDHVPCRVGTYDRDMRQFGMDWVTPNAPPLWKGIDQRVTEHPMRFSRGDDTLNLFCVIVLSAPHMTPKTYVLELAPWQADPHRRVTVHEDLAFKEYER